MANEEHLQRLQQGVSVWNTWREDHPETKSECIRFVHSCCSLGLCFGSDALDSSGDLWLLVYP